MFENSYDVLTTYEVMDYLNIGKNSLYKLLNSGKLKGFRIGKTWKIPRKALEKYIDENIWKLRKNRDWQSSVSIFYILFIL